MTKKDIEERIIMDKKIEKKKRIIGDDFIEKSYQPTEDTLDTDNPPGGGSGVPEPKKEND